MTITKIKEPGGQHEIKNIRISRLKFDPTNPNKLNDQQIHGLRRSMERFGYLTPIVVDRDFLIADGEHRVQVYKEFGKKEIPAYVLDLTDTERRTLRQTMNKLRGEHDFGLDVEEIVRIAKDSDSALHDLATLIAMTPQSLQYMIDQQSSALAGLADVVNSDEGKERGIGEIATRTKCPKCGFEW